MKATPQNIRKQILSLAEAEEQPDAAVQALYETADLVPPEERLAVLDKAKVKITGMEEGEVRTRRHAEYQVRRSRTIMENADRTAITERAALHDEALAEIQQVPSARERRMLLRELHTRAANLENEKNAAKTTRP